MSIGDLNSINFLAIVMVQIEFSAPGNTLGRRVKSTRICRY